MPSADAAPAPFEYSVACVTTVTTRADLRVTIALPTLTTGDTLTGAFAVPSGGAATVPIRAALAVTLPAVDALAVPVARVATTAAGAVAPLAGSSALE